MSHPPPHAHLPQLGEASIRGLRRHEYELLVNAGVFDGQRLELLHGQLVEMSPQGDAHADVVMFVTQTLTLALGRRYLVRCQLPLVAAGDNVPEPDLVVLPRSARGREWPLEVLLLVEVSASSLPIDRRTKRDLYAVSGVPEYWVVDVAAECVHIYRQPVDGEFTATSHVARGESITPIAVGDVTIAVDDLFVLREPA